MKNRIVMIAIAGMMILYGASFAQIPNSTNDNAPLFYRVNDLQMYPNPLADNTHVILTAPSLGPVYVDVIDLNGNVVRSAQYPLGIYDLDVDMSRLPVGLYSLRVYEQGLGYHNLRVVKD